jgi:hypothetical protein
LINLQLHYSTYSVDLTVYHNNQEINRELELQTGEDKDLFANVPFPGNSPKLALVNIESSDSDKIIIHMKKGPEQDPKKIVVNLGQEVIINHDIDTNLKLVINH